MQRFHRSRVLNRRSFLTGAGATGAAMLLSRFGRAQVSDSAVYEGDCESEPAVEMLFDWRAGKQVYPTLGEMAPPPGWQLFNHPSLLPPFLIPPGWNAYAFWADSYDRDGVPEWQDKLLYLPQLTLNRVVSPDEDAVFEYAVGTVQPDLLTTMQSADLARRGLLGADVRYRQVCVIDDQLNALAPGWFTVDRQRTNLLLTFGNALQMPSLYLPGTVVSYNTMYGPRRHMKELMYDYFLRFMFQFLGGGGSNDPTPTPTV